MMPRACLLGWALGALLVVVLVGGAAPAQAADDPARWQVDVTPYLWIATTHVKTRTPLVRAPEVDADVSFTDTIEHLKGIPVMGSAEVRRGDVGVVVDIIHLPVGTSITTRNVFFSGGSAHLTADGGTALFLYRVFADAAQTVDVGAGVRAWGFSIDLGLNAGLLPGASASRAASWADPLVGARYHRDLDAGLGATLYGDVGGFSAGARIDWQLMATLDYQATSWLGLRAGYRAVAFSYRNGADLGFDTQMHGPILGGRIRF
jgi:hypothetical protein